MHKFVDKMEELANKYGFKIELDDDLIMLMALNTDGNMEKWIKVEWIDNEYVVECYGNTDQCNLWFSDTRKDLTPDKLIQFVDDLNNTLELSGSDRYTLKELIDSEDWQEIANIADARIDERYNK